MKKTDQKILKEIIRVDHAGERGAIKIYEGQLLALNTIKKDENLNGFFENNGTTKFFRTGKSGNWKEELSNSQIKYIEKEFNSEMKFLGYL